MTYLTGSKNALAAHIAARRLRGCEHASDGCCARCIADALIASGAVTPVATLAEPVCRLLCELDGNPRLFVPGEVSAVIAKALADVERSQ